MRFSLLIALAVLAACQPVPKPFSHGSAPPNDLLKLADAQGIKVLPVTDSKGKPMTHVTGKMVLALHEQNIPATYGGNSRSSYLLQGKLSTPPAAPAVIWTLQTQQGDEIGKVVQPLRNGAEIAAEYVAGGPTKLATPAPFERSAAALAALIQDDPPNESILPPLHVGAVTGAPGDGNSRLRAAMEQLLPRTGLESAPRADADSLVITGSVTVDPAQGGEQSVKISWTVRDPYGVEVGTISQARPVAAGSLDSNWGLVANEAALAGAAGIAEMVRQIDWSQGFQPPPANG